MAIARALIGVPGLLICDEPVTALDVSIRSQILNLMKGLQDLHDLTYLFISHDLAVVRYVADRIGVMYLGKLVEIGTGDDIYFRAAHPYTRGLLDTIPVPTSPQLAQSYWWLRGKAAFLTGHPVEGTRAFVERERYIADAQAQRASREELLAIAAAVPSSARIISAVR